MNSQSVTQASLVPDGNRHSSAGRYLLRWWQQGTAGGGAEYLDDFLPGNERLSPQARTFGVGYSSLRQTLSTCKYTSVIDHINPNNEGGNKLTRAFTRFPTGTIACSSVQCLERKLKRGSFAPRNDVTFKVYSVNFYTECARCGRIIVPESEQFPLQFLKREDVRGQNFRKGSRQRNGTQDDFLPFHRFDC